MSVWNSKMQAMSNQLTHPVVPLNNDQSAVLACRPVRCDWSGGVWCSGRTGLAALLLVAVVGCGDGRPDRVPVSGTVLIDGKPLTTGSIRFVPEGARPSAADIDESGRFTLSCYDGDDGAVLGTHRVQVAARQITGDETVRWLAPNRYADFRTSGLVVEVTEPTDSLVIDLTWNNEKPNGQ